MIWVYEALVCELEPGKTLRILFLLHSLLQVLHLPLLFILEKVKGVLE